jgi:hypothetical protein
MKLYDNWKTIAVKAWSFRFMALAAIANGAALVVSFLPGFITLTMAKMLGLALLNVVFTMLAMWSRLVAQKELKAGE